MSGQLNDKNYEKITYSLAKSLHHVNIALEYMQDVKRECSGSLKHTFTGYINKCQYIVNDISDKLTPETREVFKRELSNSFNIEAINDKLINIDEKGLAAVEDFIDSLDKK
jgi:hypothetical protein